MSEAIVKNNNGRKQYINGIDNTYTGFLFAKYDNGKIIFADNLK